jgi:hypothetical protein
LSISDPFASEQAACFELSCTEPVANLSEAQRKGLQATARGIEYRFSQYEAKTFVYPIPILNLGFVGFKQELSTNQVTARIGYKF